MREARHDLDLETLRRVVELLARARRIDVYGYGGSGFLAGETQHCLASLGVASVAYSDPTLQMVSAPRLTAEDVLFVLSFSGRTSYLISNMEIAKKAGARIVSISAGGSVVASLADENINLNA
ncbi:SIS domain-containing protein [Ensifer sp. ENS09]|uniref:SIS domain-containing protein n=1 Tax=Ensifer sp. ENS09 TaxID=2769263 RepID=UPI00177C737C|nr:SIS domain-containing protein [Ensifer sp. ENS09]MBD9649986.1 SIS domain-containing protein [Ensifer sp. ENS09]